MNVSSRLDINYLSSGQPFGSPPAFGNGNPIMSSPASASSAFGQFGGSAANAPTFGSAASAPTFGSMAASGSTPSFGSGGFGSPASPPPAAQSPLQLTMLVSLVELNRHQQVPTPVGYSVEPRQLPALLSGFLVVGALSQLQAHPLGFLEDLRLQTQQPPLVEFLEEPSQPLVLLSGFSVAVLSPMQVPLQGSLEDHSQHLQPPLLGFLVELPSQRLRVQCSAGDHRQVPVEYLAGRSQLLRPVEYSEVGLSLSLSSLRQSSSQRNLPQFSEHSRPRSLNPAGACLASRQHPPLQVNIV